MKKAFSMIELVFVIIIVGILSATALPRFIGTSDDAHTAKMQHFVGMLNSSVGAQLWTEVQRAEVNVQGSVKNSLHSNSITSERTKIPFELNQGADISLLNCAEAGTPISVDLDVIVSSNNGEYKVGCIDSDMSISPHFFLHDGVHVITR